MNPILPCMYVDHKGLWLLIFHSQLKYTLYIYILDPKDSERANDLGYLVVWGIYVVYIYIYIFTQRLSPAQYWAGSCPTTTDKCLRHGLPMLDYIYLYTYVYHRGWWEALRGVSYWVMYIYTPEHHQFQVYIYTSIYICIWSIPSQSRVGCVPRLWREIHR